MESNEPVLPTGVLVDSEVPWDTERRGQCRYNAFGNSLVPTMDLSPFRVCSGKTLTPGLSAAENRANH